MFVLSRMQEAIRQDGLGGWLFASIHHRDKGAIRILELDPDSVETRPWFYLVPALGEPIKIVSGIEAGALDSLPGRKLVWTSREALRSHLTSSALPETDGLPVACQYSPEFPMISYLDHGTAVFLEGLGFRLTQSAGLMQRYRGVLGPDEIKSHRRAADHLGDIVDVVWSRLAGEIRAGVNVPEEAVQSWITGEFSRRGLVTNHPPIVAAGAATGDPHYNCIGGNRMIRKNQVVQLDLWAKEAAPGSIFADISWVGYTGPRPSAEAESLFAAATAARDGAVAYVARRLAAGKTVTGAEVDAESRRIVAEAGYVEGLRHRTGHAIDEDIHGSGVNLDSVEFPDTRLLLEGSCCSVEPGLYYPGLGVRTEINLYIQDGSPRLSGRPPQTKLLVLEV